MPSSANGNGVPAPVKGGEMSMAGKIGIFSTILLVVGVIIYKLVNNSNTVAATPLTVAPISTVPLTGAAAIQQAAIDPQDEATTQAMINAVQGSQFASSMPFIYSMLPNYMQGGPNNIGDAGGTIVINNQKVTPLSSAFAGAMWNGWASSVISNIGAANSGSTPIPANGHTPADAKAAFALLIQINNLWSSYKTNKVSSVLGIPLPQF